MPVSPLFATYRAAFELELARYGFLRGNDGRWRGTVATSWYDDDGTQHHRDEQIAIEIRDGFPFDKPRVTPVTTDPVICESLHREPSGNACLWRDDITGWVAGMTINDLLLRVAEWFQRCRQRSWRQDEQPSDLHLYYRGERARTMVAITDDWLPPQNTPIGRFSWWQTNNWIAYAGDPQASSATPGTKNNNPVFARLLIGSEARREVGVWLRLDSDPRVPRTLHDIVALGDAAIGTTGATIVNITTLLGTKVRDTERLHIALGYPGATGGDHWLFLHAKVRVREGKRWSTTEGLKAIPIESCITVPASREALARRVGEPAERLLDKHIVIFGVGALGSEIATLLARTGAAKITLVDSDRITPTNAVRHVAGLRYAGLAKTTAVEHEIHEHAPYCKVEKASETWKPDEIAALIGSADLIIDATARNAFSGLLNEVALSHGKTAMYVTAHRRGSVGRIRLVRPQRDACITCYESRDGHMNNPAYPLIPAMDEGTFVEEGCATPTITAAALYLQMTANVGARAALSLLTGEDIQNHTLVVVVPAEDVTGPLAHDGVHAASYEPITGCESCTSRGTSA